MEVPPDGFGAAYVAAVRRAGEAGTGCFGMRIMWTDVPGVLERLISLQGDERSSDEPGALRRAFGISRYIHLGRRDRVAEAVSLVIADQSGLWHLNADGSERERSAPHREPEYDEAAIAEEYAMLEAEAAGWAGWFARHGIEPLRLEYEELAADAIGQLARVGAFLDVPIPEGMSVGTARMASERNADWAARFRREVLGEQQSEADAAGGQ